MKPAGRKPGQSRADAASFFDFNAHPRPTHALAAGRVTPEQLERLFETLDRADEQFSDDAWGATLSAIEAVASFLASTPYNGNGRFSRPLELLLTELRTRPNTGGKRILPATGGGSGGVLARMSDHHVKAAAAYAAQFLHKHAGLTVDASAREIAHDLEARQFPFAAKRNGKSGGIKAWRRDFARDIRGKDGDPRAPSPAVLAYRAFCKSPPVPPTGDFEADGIAIRTWFGDLVGRAGYGAVA